MRADQILLWHHYRATFYQERAAKAAESARFYFDQHHPEQAISSQASARNFADAARYHLDLCLGRTR